MAKKLILHGMVQGVCCRAYCSQYARRFMVKGSASNISDGTVRLILDTDDKELLRNFISALKINPNGYGFYGRIDHIDISDYDGVIKGDYVF
ncbi:acylphosphatase [Spirochaetota bacterium]